jgi:hypothetical protein
MNEHKWPEAIRELQILTKKHPRNIEIMNLLGGLCSTTARSMTHSWSGARRG